MEASRNGAQFKDDLKLGSSHKAAMSSTMIITVSCMHDDVGFELTE